MSPLKQWLAFEGYNLPFSPTPQRNDQAQACYSIQPLEQAMVEPKKRPSLPEGEDLLPIPEPELFDSELGDDIDLDDETDFIEPDIPLDEESDRVINPE